MKIIRGIENYKHGFRDVVLTIGNFDGVHRGHQKIFRAVTEKAAELGGTPMAVTFDPHPVTVISPERGLRILTPTDEKLRLMGAYGIKAVLLINFSRQFAGLPPDDFVKDVLVEKIGVREVIVGHGYAFGKGRKGTTELLRRRGRRYGFGLRVIRNARLGGEVVSSSRIRALLLKGRVAEASEYLGRPYMVDGTVVKGTGRGGSILGIHTANIDTPHELIPREGVYAVLASVGGPGGKLYEGAANIGYNPTFHNTRMSFEVHLFGYSGDLRDSDLRVYFVERIRDEKAFPSPEALKAGIEKDFDVARSILAVSRPRPI